MVISYQSSVIRSFSLDPYVLRLLSMIFRGPYFIIFILITDICLLITEHAHARDFGVQGVISPIKEEDPIAVIQSKLKAMEDNGELERHHQELQKKTKAAVERPRPVEGITKAQNTRFFYYDPTYTVKEDLKDHLGNLIYSKESKINPLKTVTLSQDLLFFDGDDEEQREWAKTKFRKETTRFILTKGAPLVLSEEFKVPVYFDQGGVLTKKLGIQHVPAVVMQEGLRLLVSEFGLSLCFRGTKTKKEALPINSKLKRGETP